MDNIMYNLKRVLNESYKLRFINVIAFIFNRNLKILHDIIGYTIDQILKKPPKRVRYGLDQYSREPDTLVCYQTPKINEVLVVCSNETYTHVNVSLPNVPVKCVRDAELNRLLSDTIASTVSKSHIAIFLTNNDLSRVPSSLTDQLSRRVDRPIFIVHDWDNHHELSLSLRCVELADYYVPAHEHGISKLRQFVDPSFPYCPIGSCQWSTEFLRENLDFLSTTKRFGGPLGKFSRHEIFVFREAVIKTASDIFESRGRIRSYSNHRYHDRRIGDRLSEWASFKTHWIVSTGTDIPIRVFDALITGGLPIVPGIMARALIDIGVPADYIFSYDTRNSSGWVNSLNRAEKYFDDMGQRGVQERIKYAIDNLHHSVFMEMILRYGIYGESQSAIYK
jgi:hypothetical protein